MSTERRPFAADLQMPRLTLVVVCAMLFAAGCRDAITEPIVPDAVVLNADADTVVWGAKTTLNASYRVGGATVPSDEGLRWTSLQPQYFQVDSLTGEGEAFQTYDLGAHPVQVTAESHGFADTMTVYVIPSIHQLVMTLSSAVALGRTLHPVIQALDGVNWVDFTPPPEAGAPVLRSFNPAVVSVKVDGNLTAVGAGEAWVTATLQGASDSTLVRVRAGYPIALIPASGGLLPRDVNDAGQALATGFRVGSFLFDGDAKIAIPCDARAINKGGTVVCGDGRVYAGGTLGPYPNGQVLATGDITDAGVIFGMRHVVLPPDGAVRSDPVIWDGTVETALPPASCCGPLGSIVAANELGHVIGSARSAPNVRALLLRGSEGRALELPHPEWETPGPVAQAMNDIDDVVGTGSKVRAAGTAAIWLAAEQWTGRFLGLRTQSANGISNAGIVLGDAVEGAFVWRADRYALLSDLVAEDGWTIGSGAVISRAGMILAVGKHVSGKSGLVRITVTGAP